MNLFNTLPLIPTAKKPLSGYSRRPIDEKPLRIVSRSFSQLSQIPGLAGEVHRVGKSGYE